MLAIWLDWRVSWCRVRTACQTEVGDNCPPGVSVFGENDIVAFQVTVDYLFAVRLGESRTELQRDRTGFLLGQWMATETFRASPSRNSIVRKSTSPWTVEAV